MGLNRKKKHIIFWHWAKQNKTRIKELMTRVNLGSRTVSAIKQHKIYILCVSVQRVYKSRLSFLE